MVRFDTAETRWAGVASRIWRAPEEPPPPYLWPLYIGQPPAEPIPPKGAARRPVVEARVNHGRWQTECPFCSSAQHASSSDHLFYCANCMNAEAGHRTLPVAWPRNRKAIEEQLAARPLLAHMNWEPGETIRDLRAQDEEWKAMTGG